MTPSSRPSAARCSRRRRARSAGPRSRRPPLDLLRRHARGHGTLLRLAVGLAHRCGAHALEDRALAELRATGARPRRRATTGADALTPSDRRVAELAVAGRQNREIAQALFVTTATVEFHLRNAYRKLGIGGRPVSPAGCTDRARRYSSNSCS